MADKREPSHPPSEPIPPAMRTSSSPAAPSTVERPVRIQLFVALLAGLVLVATALYLWRRPRNVEGGAADSDSQADAGAAASIPLDAAMVTTSTPQAIDAGSPNALSLSDPRIVSCRDGAKKVSADQCEHIASVEQDLVRAIEQAATCVPSSAGGGTIEYMADVSFGRKVHQVAVTLPKGSRSMKNGKALAACGKAMKQAVKDLSIDGVEHSHSRYMISITATYPGPLKSK